MPYVSDRLHSAGRSAVAGFTLAELLVVMIIIVLLAGIAVAIFPQRIDQARQTRTQADISVLENALERYRYDMGDYPTTEQGLEVLLTKPTEEGTGKWRGPYVKRRIPTDGWGREYAYRCPGEHNSDSFDLWSLGKDGKEGGEDFNADINNWEDVE